VNDFFQILGKSEPKRGGINCKRENRESPEDSDVGIGL